ncbi:hypothetical protein [Pseudomonas sp. Irchel 3E13]|uniref:hypothetical protein n=1 Tax=Pseudomonas sp. Irchel 3E13 TaxID=2008975 RepID=UPI000BA45E8B|nr:hypothetical protein [Pseudomonas sp. Irchel 3E13]
MSEVVEDDTLKMVVKLTSESKMLYNDLESISKMRRARRILYLAQLGLMFERTLEEKTSTGAEIPVKPLVPMAPSGPGEVGSDEPSKAAGEPPHVESAGAPTLPKIELPVERAQVATESKNAGDQVVDATPLEQSHPPANEVPSADTAINPPLNRRKPGFKL